MTKNRIWWSFLLTLFLVTPCLADNRSYDLPDMEMLEYLGTFRTNNGKPLDHRIFEDRDKNSRKAKKPVSARTDLKNIKKPEQKKGNDDEK